MRYLLTAVLAIGFLNCGDDNPQQIVEEFLRGQKGETCRARNDCVDGLACVNETCVGDAFNVARSTRGCDFIQCLDADDCVEYDSNCVTLRDNCATGDTPSCTQFGLACSFGCDANRCFVSCATDSDCTGGQFCQNSTCVECRVGNDCNVGETCLNNACVPTCQSTLTDCPAFHTCENGACEDQGCQSDRECKAWMADASSVCRSGECSIPCQTDSDCNDEDNYAFLACISGECTYVGCETDEECRAAVGAGGYYGTPDVMQVECRENPVQDEIPPNFP